MKSDGKTKMHRKTEDRRTEGRMGRKWKSDIWGRGEGGREVGVGVGVGWLTYLQTDLTD